MSLKFLPLILQNVVSLYVKMAFETQAYVSTASIA